jgi:ABC-type transport system involved in cytochrome bd biosynthesis fused ATPase/permease subunit
LYDELTAEDKQYNDELTTENEDKQYNDELTAEDKQYNEELAAEDEDKQYSDELTFIIACLATSVLWFS